MSSNIDIMFHYFLKIRKKYPNIDNDLETILRPLRHPRDAMCMADIKESYRQLTGEKFPMRCGSLGVGEFLLTIPYVACYCNENGTLMFYSVDGF
ncbi:maternal effect protein oskar [Musca domestica]|uniref:Maternal effect protein oskar n=1 Tax=Musca domestica TaxID=7370 RepID=A0A9J7IA95_MUSDO|nr:maternal effect protein oskar [Musca domestica]